MMPKEILKRCPWHEWRHGNEADLPSRSACRWIQPIGPTTNSLKTPSGHLPRSFKVSAEAMRIRAEGMKLLLKKRERGLFDE